MARKSRKNIRQPEIITEKAFKRWNVALYVRLSVEDNGKDSDSIENQISLLEGFISSHSDLCKVETFIDNGYTGTNFLRPGFERLMKCVKHGEINCIIVKDLSRLGRNYIETSNFIEKICPLYNMRFISVNDGYDTEHTSDSEGLSMQLANIINDSYAKDISRKVSSALRAKMDRGEFISNFAPYGYLKDTQNKNHLVIDPTASLIVHQIFVWRSNGMSYMGINRRLNEAGIPSPGQHRIDLGIETNNNKKNKVILWNKHIITDILHNCVYAGHLAQGKSQQELYGGIPYHLVDLDMWRVVYNTHEAIISQELFDAVQRVNESAKLKAKSNLGKYDHLPKEKNIYGGKLRCAKCGATMKLHRSIKKGGGKAYFMYKCPTFAEHGSMGCSDIKIQKEMLDNVLLSFIKSQMDAFMDAVAILEAVKNKTANTRQVTKADRIGSLKHELAKEQNELHELYLRLKDEEITLNEYLHGKELLSLEIERINKEIELESNSVSESDSESNSFEKWKAIIEQFDTADQISEELIGVLIDSITISEDGTLNIQLKFSNNMIYDELNRNAW